MDDDEAYDLVLDWVVGISGKFRFPGWRYYQYLKENEYVIVLTKVA